MHCINEHYRSLLVCFIFFLNFCRIQILRSSLCVNLIINFTVFWFVFGIRLSNHFCFKYCRPTRSCGQNVDGFYLFTSLFSNLFFFVVHREGSTGTYSYRLALCSCWLIALWPSLCNSSLPSQAVIEHASYYRVVDRL